MLCDTGGERLGYPQLAMLICHRQLHARVLPSTTIRLSRSCVLQTQSRSHDALLPHRRPISTSAPLYGVWGLRSDENDGTYDQLELGLDDRATGVELSDEGRATLIPMLEEGLPNCFNAPGVVLLLIKQRAHAMRPEVIERTIKSLTTDLKTGSISLHDGSKFEPGSNNDREERKRIVYEEIKLCQSYSASEFRSESPIAIRGTMCVYMEQQQQKAFDGLVNVPGVYKQPEIESDSWTIPKGTVK